MDKTLALSRIYKDADFNPACFDFSEAEAREKSLWRDARPMPTLAELEAANVLVQTDLQKEKIKKLFSGIRELWQNLSDEFAANNAALGITQEGKTKEVADKFNGVIYYLNCNAPMEAIRELNLIVTDPKYITQEVITNMSNALLKFIQDNK